MSVTLTGTGGLFTRLGLLMGGIAEHNTNCTTINTRANTIQDQFEAALQYIIDGFYTGYRDAAQNAEGGGKTYLQSKAKVILVDQVHADAALIDKNEATALAELQRQMIGSGTLYNPDNDVDASTVSATAPANVTGITNTGNGAFITSVTRPDGRPDELVKAETIELRITTDGQGTGTARNEQYSIRGEFAIGDTLSHLWPGGSGVVDSAIVCDAEVNAGQGNLLYNSDFYDVTTADQPDNWGAALVGAYGTDIGIETTTVYRTGKKALKFTGTAAGTLLSSIAQSFSTIATPITPAAATSGTTSVLKPSTVYAWNLYIRKSAGLSAGVFKIDLFDGTNTINDDAGTANSSTIAHGSITTSYAAFNGFFRTPKVLPTTPKLRISISTALTDAEIVYIADLCFVEAHKVGGQVGETSMSATGVYCAGFAGSTNWIVGDAKNAVINNNRAGLIQEYFDRLFDMRSKGLQLPSDTGGTETIADSLVA